MKWIPVTESLPDLRINVLVAWWRASTRECEILIAWREEHYDWQEYQETFRWINVETDEYMDREDVSHWMPLPELPEAQP